MSTVEEIEKAIESLPRDQFYRLREWVKTRFEDEWDRYIEEDVHAGRLDHFAQQALEEHRASLNRCQFLLTWNCAHLANANKFEHIRHMNNVLGLFVPTLTTPMELLNLNKE